MDINDFAIWFDGFVAGKSQLSAEDIEILREKIEGLRNASVPAWCPKWPTLQPSQIYGPMTAPDTAWKIKFWEDISSEVVNDD